MKSGPLQAESAPVPSQLISRNRAEGHAFWFESPERGDAESALAVPA
jgi:hypothetical protein